ncbi:alkaline ceramidase ydc1 [Coemansia javaensis]|uniref:Alkaline ceramidase ydc1 n=1 Tax=Coemansia javaensis TaxID=2761396 RepID=A0A9W8H5A5_9FUNG|nr:alkaline ceramidase ydc1 [Coemansia javaensis]
MGMIIVDNVRNETAYFWGERTSTIDWCEENYAVSNYIAEFWNTLTNLAMVMLAVLGACSSIRNGHGKRVTAMYAVFLVVGLGSMCFHATLKYSTQLLDELPMLYLCATGLYAIVEIDRKIRYGIKVPVALALFQVAITVTYMFWVQNPIFHQAAFAATTLLTICFGYRRLGEMPVTSETRRLLQRLVLHGFLGMCGGFLVWNIDNIFCHRLRSYRTYVGAPLDAVLQLHGWWHILTAYGGGYLLVWVHMLRLAYAGQDHLVTVRYVLGHFPYVALRVPKKVD